jgi:hypothetical protein
MTSADHDTTGAPVTTSSGYAFLRAPGISKDAPIVCLERRPDLIPKAELEYLRELHHLPTGRKLVEVVGQAVVEHSGVMLDALAVKDQDGAEFVVYFNVTRSELFLCGQGGAPWYLPDAQGFIRDVKSPSVWVGTLLQVLGTMAFIAACIAVYLLWLK